MLKKIILLGILFVGSLSASIIETNDIALVKQSVVEDTLVLFNITGTLYEPATILSDHQWRCFFSDRVYSLIQNKNEADQLINRIKNDIVRNIPKKLVEESIPQLITFLQDKKIPVLGITQKQTSNAYADDFGLITSRHLLNLGINLEKTLSYLNIKEDPKAEYSFIYGILFGNKMNIGTVLSSFLNRLEKKPGRIVMVDNALDNLTNIENELKNNEIQFVGFRYGKSDILKTNFDPVIGIIQFFHFIDKKEILSNEQAFRIKLKTAETDYNALLDAYILRNRGS